MFAAFMVNLCTEAFTTVNPLKKLAGQTAVYGLSSIVGRLINYLLVPLYTAEAVGFPPDQYGVITEFYAYVAFLIVILTYGMETALFRFFNKESNKEQVYSTTLISLLASSLIFIVAASLFASPIASAMGYPDQSYFVSWFALILGMDAIAAIPFARLRLKGQAKAFAAIKLINIGINVSLNLFLILGCKQAYEAGADNFMARLYDPEIGVGYVFLINLVASGATLLLLLPAMRGIGAGFNGELWKRMFRYALPLVAVGFAGIINETFDRALLKYLLPYDEKTNLWHLGVYGANYKLAMLMTMVIQAFRYAAEPFFFSRAENKESKALFARILDFFVIGGLLIFLVISLYIDLFKYFIPNQEYWSGLHIVPILLLANLFFGIYINLSMWYKLSDKTGLGALVSIAAAGLTIGLNVWWIPVFGYTGSAWATLIVYVFLTVASWLLGRKYYPIPYQVGKIVSYMAMAVLLFRLSSNYSETWLIPAFLFKAAIILLFIGFVVAVERRTGGLNLKG